MTRNNIMELIEQRVVLLDGGMGTSLMKLGLDTGSPGELWNLDHPEKVKKVHAGFIEAGSDVIQTNSFGGNRFRLESHGLSEKHDEINLAAARIAREAAGDDRIVAGNIGPSGLFLSPVGDAEPIVLEDGFCAQAKQLAKGGVDYISIETMMDLEEALIALAGVRKGAPGLPVSVCMVFEKKKRGFFSAMGNKPDDAVWTLVQKGADMVGANCSLGSNEMKEMTESMVISCSGAPVVTKPNAGLPVLKAGKAEYKQLPDDYASDLVAMARTGARAVGGCCGTDSRFISSLHGKLKEVKL